MSRPTIQTTLLGRLGNQLFTYSATRVMALESGCQLVLTGDALERFHAQNRLGCFHLPDDVLFKEDKSFNLRQKIGYFLYLCLCRHKNICQIADIESKYQKLFHRFGLILNQEGYLKPLPLSKGSWYALGYFQSDKYFAKHEELIRKELTFRTELFSLDVVSLGLEIHSNPKSVCLHIRRGDYLNDPTFFVCDNIYYFRALEQMQKLVPDATYYVFSDNIDDVRNLFSKYENLTFHYIDSKYTDQESLYLGSCCRNFIMTNSTFSWWMQYLSDNKNKVVLAPSRWYNTNNPCDIYQDNWMLVDTRIQRDV